MRRRLMSLLLAGALATSGLAACSTVTTTPETVSQSAAQASTSTDSTGAATSSAPTTTTASVLAENTAPQPTTVTTSSAATVSITLDGSSISADGAGVTVDGSTATITAAGAYQLSGTLDDGQIVIDTDDIDPVTLILSGASLSSSTSAPLYVKEAAGVELVLADGTENQIADAASYVYASADEDEPNAALFSDDPLRISGGGTLTVLASYNDGIASKNGLTISGGTIAVTAADDGVRGKDYLVVEGGTLTVNAGGDGLVSDNAEDAALGYIAISGGTLAITAGGDGVAAATDLAVSAGELSVTSGGGSSAALAADQSAKGLKAGVRLVIDDGSFSIDAAEDALHSDGDLTVNGGTFSIAAGDDAAHGETALTVNGGTLDVSTSFEGLESAAITLNGGDVTVVASDDGVNAAGDDATTQGGFGGGGPGGSFTLDINGGTLVVTAGGDGIDANGSITMTDGLVLVNGPTAQMNGALDYDGSFTISGGTFVAVGSAGMAQAPDGSSSQNSLLLFFDQAQAAGTLIQIVDSTGMPVLAFAPTTTFQALTFSAPELATGETYQVLLGGSAGGEASDGLYTGGSVTGGTASTSFTVQGVVTQVGSGGGRGRFR